MKLFKRLTSMVLAMVMIVTMLSTGLTSQASISYSKADVTVAIVVPETIYLQPGTGQMQYYVSGTSNGSTPSPNKATTGSYSFTASKTASSISLSFEMAYGHTVDGNVSNLIANNTTTLAGTVSNASISASANETLIWIFTYVVDGVTYTSKAYSYIYAPYLGQTGSQGNFTYKTTIGNEPKLCVYSFLTGIHSTNGGPYRSAFVGTENNYFKSPLAPNWNNGNVPQSSGDNYALPDAESYFPEDSTGGVTHRETGRDRNGDTSGHDYGSTSGYGILTIDKSRYEGAAFTTIPNFAAGFMMFGSVSSSVTHKCSSFTATASGSTLNFASDYDYENEAKGRGYYPFAPTGTIPSANTNYSVVASYQMRRSNSSTVTMTYTFGLHVILVDKSALRTRVNNAVSANYQASDYDSTKYAAFEAALQSAAEVLGKPDVNATEIQNAIDLLHAKEQEMTDGPATYRATVTHKLPASDGFVYNYNGVDYTASNGFVTITETMDYPSSADVTIGTNTFNGYSITPATQVYNKCRQDINQTYTYTASTSKIYFDYVYPDHVINGTSVSEMTVSYGRKYGTFPAPLIDGWKFNGWVETGTTNTITGDTYTTMIGGKLYLTASWSPYFTGGFGTSTEPFMIANMSDLDNIDNVNVYQVNNGSNGTTGKFYKQTANISFSFNSAPVLVFGGTYEGDYKTLTIPSSITVQSESYGSVFGAVSGAAISNLTVNVQGKMLATGSSGYVGFVGNASNSTLDNIQISFLGTTGTGTNSGILAGKTVGTTVTNCCVDAQAGTVGGDGFIGARSGGTLRNTWVLAANGVTVSRSNANNTMRVRENGSATVSFDGSRYVFTATPNSGWETEIRDAEDSSVSSGNTYQSNASDTGLEYYVCFVKDITFVAGEHGTLTGAGTFKMRQGEVMNGLNPVPETGYRFVAENGWTMSRANGTISGTGPYAYTMSTLGGTVTANFTVNRYKVTYDGNGGAGVQIAVPAAAWYDANQMITIQEPAERNGYTFNYWTTSQNGAGSRYLGNQQYEALSTVDGTEITLYAQWTQKTYDVTFYLSEDAPLSQVTATWGEEVEFPTATKIGYKDLNWYLDWNTAQINPGNGFPAGTTRAVYENTNYYAGWTPISYTIVFSAENASNVPDPQTVAYDSGVFVIPVTFVPIRTGYVFTGWDTQETGNGLRYQVNSPFPGNQTTTDGDSVYLYAQWTPAQYTVTWNLDGGSLNGSTSNPQTTETFGETYHIPAGKPVQDTKSFVGWYTRQTDGELVKDLPTVAITADTTFYARWTDATYDILYDANGGSGSVASQHVTYGARNYTYAINTFTRPGYTFAGWNTDRNGNGYACQAGAIPTTDLSVVDESKVTLYAQWTGDTFKISYELHGTRYGITGSLMTTNNVRMEGAAVTLRSRNTATTSSGTYRFGGWAFTEDAEAACEIAYAGGAKFQLTEDVLANCDYDLSTHVITLHAVWLRENTVTWDLVGGKYNNSSTNPTTTVVRGDNFVLPENEPTRNRYRFDGWFTTTGVGTGQQVTNDTWLNANADQTVYARWTLEGNLTSSYTTKYYYEGLTKRDYSADPVIVTGYAELGQTDDDGNPLPIEAVIDPPTGFVLDTSEGIVNELSGLLTDDQDPNAIPLVLVVHYARQHFNVVFNAGGGSGTMANQDFAYSETKDLTANAFTKTGYNFAGWSTTANGTTAQYSDGGQFTMNTTADVPLYALWTAKEFTLTFTDGFGVTIESSQVAYGAPVSAPADPTKTGYTFNGWDANIPATMPANNVTINATWTANPYKVIFNGNGGTGSMNDQGFVFNETKNLTANAFTKTGYNFAGWGDSPSSTTALYTDGGSFTMNVAQDVTLYAIWTNKEFTLTFNDGHGGTISTAQVTYGAPVSAPADPVREGYTFDGWDADIPATMPANNVTITAKWTANVYKVYFDANGGTGTMAYQEIEFNKAANLTLCSFTKAGWSFVGWGESATSTSAKYADGGRFTMNTASDVTLYAVWGAKTYTVAFAKNDEAATGEMSPIQCTYDETYTLPANAFTKTGARFIGWKVDNVGELLLDQQTISNLTASEATVTLYAQWEDIPYTLHFNLNGGTAVDPIADITSTYGQQVTLPSGAGLVLETASESRTFLGWLADGVTYAPGDPFTIPAWDVTLSAVWSANYYAVNQLTTLIAGYSSSNLLPANEANDPAYAAGGDWATRLSSNGMYAWNNFNTSDLRSAYAAAGLESNKNLPQSRQADVDALAQAMQNALNNLTLLGVDLTVKYSCKHWNKSEKDEATNKYYPACEARNKHSYSTLTTLINTIVSAAPADSLYTADSVTVLQQAASSIESALQAATLKKPAQSELEIYVDRLAEAYHTSLVLKNADYSAVDALRDEYLPTTKFVSYNNLESYYTAETVQALKSYYEAINRTYKITHQSDIDNVIVPAVRERIDALLALRADYRNVFELILNIPKSETFSYPSSSITDPAWIEWAQANAGAISNAIDKDFLNLRYEASTVNALNKVLDSFNWNLDVFSQDTINGNTDISYVARLRAAIDALVRRTYSIIYMRNDGTDVVFTTYSGKYYGDTISLPTGTPTRGSYVFLGWSYDPETMVPVHDNDTVAGETIIYAIWSFNCVNVSYNLNGGSGTLPASQIVELGDTIDLPAGADFEKEGFTFIGWSADPDATTGAWTFTPTEKADVTMYAVWATTGVQLIAQDGSKTVIDKENDVIYGLSYDMTESTLLNEYLAVEGNGEIEVIYSGYVGTGVTVKVKNLYTGEVDEEYKVVIFGDVDGDGIVTTEDVRMIKGHVSGAAHITDAAQIMAADMDNDGMITMQDAIIMKGIINSAQKYDQAERKII